MFSVMHQPHKKNLPIVMDLQSVSEIILLMEEPFSSCFQKPNTVIVRGLARVCCIVSNFLFQGTIWFSGWHSVKKIFCSSTLICPIKDALCSPNYKFLIEIIKCWMPTGKALIQVRRCIKIHLRTWIWNHLSFFVAQKHWIITTWHECPNRKIIFTLTKEFIKISFYFLILFKILSQFLKF